MNELVSIGGTSNPNRVADIVFLHGLDGDPRSTWQIANKPESFWPLWLVPEFPSAGIWSLGYDASSSNWRGTTMPLGDRGTNILDRLTTNGIGTSRPLLFVTHSLGGLVVKQALVNASSSTNPAWRDLASRVEGIVFLATPHAGSDVPKRVGFLKPFARWTRTMTELVADDANLRNLNNQFRGYAAQRHLPALVYFENRETYGLRIVNESSADPGLPGVTPIAVDEDHLSITRPASQQAQVYLGVLAFLRARLDALSTPPATPPSVTSTPVPSPASPVPTPKTIVPVSSPTEFTMPTVDTRQLRRILREKLSMTEVRTLWFDTFGEVLGNTLPNQGIDDCIPELISRAQQNPGGMDNLLDSLRHSRPDVYNALVNDPR